MASLSWPLYENGKLIIMTHNLFNLKTIISVCAVVTTLYNFHIFQKKIVQIYIVKFLTKKIAKNLKIKCIYPDEEDISTIIHKEIMQVLLQPDLFPLNKLKYQIE